MDRPKVTFLIADISGPSMGAVLVFARSLQDNYDVEIVGADQGHAVAPMYAGAFDYTPVSTPHIYRFPDFIWETPKLYRACSGDVIVAVKAFANTTLPAVFAKWLRKKKAVVLLDEWDGAPSYEHSLAKRILKFFSRCLYPLDSVYFPLIEKLIPYADGVLCTSSFLRNKFNGTIVHMGVDCDHFSPRPEARLHSLRKTLGLEGKKAIVFGGHVRPHKGIQHLLEALKSVGDEDIRWVVVGPSTEYLQTLMEQDVYRNLIIHTGAQPKDRMPDYLALADLIIIPLKQSTLSQSQLPCKVYEAMAMGKPIIAAAVSDLPEVLQDCGWTYDPGNAEDLTKIIHYVLQHPEEAEMAGKKARLLCREKYSKQQTQYEMNQAISQILNPNHGGGR